MPALVVIYRRHHRKAAPYRHVTKNTSPQLLLFLHLQTVTPVTPLESALTKTSGSHPSSQIFFSFLALPPTLPSSVSSSKFRIPHLLCLPVLCDFCIPNGSTGRKLPGCVPTIPILVRLEAGRGELVNRHQSLAPVFK